MGRVCVLITMTPGSAASLRFMVVPLAIAARGFFFVAIKRQAHPVPFPLKTGSARGAEPPAPLSPCEVASRVQVSSPRAWAAPQDRPRGGGERKECGRGEHARKGPQRAKRGHWKYRTTPPTVSSPAAAAARRSSSLVNWCGTMPSAKVTAWTSQWPPL